MRKVVFRFLLRLHLTCPPDIRGHSSSHPSKSARSRRQWGRERWDIARMPVALPQTETPDVRFQRKSHMIRGVYTAASAMLAQETAQSVISNNLANVNTPGYKGDVATFEAFRLGAMVRTGGGASVGAAIGTLGGGAVPHAVSLDLSAGPVKRTGNPLDVAATGNQFFVVRTPGGDRLTRAGEFTVGGDGVLTDTVGHPVVGADGRTIRLIDRATVAIDAQGNVLSGLRVVGALNVVSVAPGARLVKEGGRLLYADPASVTPVNRPSLLPESLEASNVSAVEEMVGMIGAMRAYEAAAKALQSEDETLGRAFNEVARA